jgi:outer membrane protein TolC
MRITRFGRRVLVLASTGLSFAAIFLGTAHAADLPAPSPLPSVEPATTELTQADAIRWALEHNPEIAAIRQQHGIAAAGVMIANTYPFNPILGSEVRAAFGPPSAGVTNSVSNLHTVQLELELRHQGHYRREGATATLSRTDWEIANQEVLLAVRVARAFDTLLYRRDKLRLLEETIKINEEAAVRVGRLFEANKVRKADVIVIQSEVFGFRAQASAARTTFAIASYDLRRALGPVPGTLVLKGGLTPAVAGGDAEALPRVALERRADLRARESALAEADARLRLEVANRYGNPVIGPAYELDPTRVNLVGAQMALPIPVLNVHRGEIRQRQAERDRAALEVRQVEVQVQQDVDAALARLKSALAWEETYRAHLIPDLRKGLAEMEKLFEAGDPGVDLLRVLDVRRKLLAAQDGYLDALWEISQARADLAAAVGDPTLLAPPAPPVPPTPPENKP